MENLKISSKWNGENYNISRMPSRSMTSTPSQCHSSPNSRPNSPRRIATENSFKFLLSSESLESQVFSHREAMEKAGRWYSKYSDSPSQSSSRSRPPSRQQSMGNFIIDNDVDNEYMVSKGSLNLWSSRQQSMARPQSMGNFIIDNDVHNEYMISKGSLNLWSSQRDRKEYGGRSISQLPTAAFVTSLISGQRSWEMAPDDNTEIDDTIKTKPRLQSLTRSTRSTRSNSNDEIIHSSSVGCICPMMYERGGGDITPNKYKNSGQCSPLLHPSSLPPSPQSPPLSSRSLPKDGPHLSQIKEALENLDSVCDKTIQKKKAPKQQQQPTQKKNPATNHCIIQ